MVRKWFCLASVFAVVVLMLAADASQARERRLFGRRNRGYNNDRSNYYGPAAGSYAPQSGADEGQRSSSYYPPEAFPTSGRGTAVFIDVSTPASAEITFDGAKTMQKGSRP